VIAGHLDKLSLVMAIPDHPWIKLAREEKIRGVRRKGEKALRQAKKAVVRIAMTVAEAGAGGPGRLFEVKSEAALDTDNPEVRFFDEQGTLGIINPDLSIGADVTAAKPLTANRGLSSPGSSCMATDSSCHPNTHARDWASASARAWRRIFGPIATDATYCSARAEFG